MRRSGGFTLLEVLVALSLLLLLGVLLGQGLRLGAAALQRTERAAEALEELRLTQAYLRRQIESAMPLAIPGSRQRLLLFAGEANAVTFIALPPAALGNGLHVLRLEVSDGALSLHWRPLQGEPPSLDLARAERRLLLADVHEADFSYLDVGENGQAVWRSEWRQRERLPALVRLRLQRAQRPWPELLVQPMLQAVDR